MNKTFIVYKNSQDHIKLISKGEWTLTSLVAIRKELEKLSLLIDASEKKIIWDLSEVEDFDSSGVLLFIEFFEKFKQQIFCRSNRLQQKSKRHVWTFTGKCTSKRLYVKKKVFWKM